MKAEEEGFRRHMLAKFAEDDRIEQMNAQKRRMKLIEHGRQVQQMIDDKRRMYEEQKVRVSAAGVVGAGWGEGSCSRSLLATCTLRKLHSLRGGSWRGDPTQHIHTDQA